MGKRANGEGSIFKFTDARGKLKWKASIAYRDSAGKLRRRSKVAKSKADAAIELQTLRNKYGRGSAEPSKMTVAEYLEHWLAASVKGSTEDTTHDGYRSTVENHIVPHIGSLRLASLEPLHIEKWLTALESVGSRTRQAAFTTLRNALNHAFRLGRIKANPCHAFKTPKDARKKIWPFARKEAKAVLDATKGHRLHAAFVLMFHLGMRQSEVFGLKWNCIDFDAKTLRIERVAIERRGKVVLKERAKTDSSRRTLSLAADTLKVLLAHRKRMLKEGHAGHEMVFCGPRGALVQRGNFRVRVWTRLLKKLGIAYRGAHHCRHTFASLALQDGVPLIAVSRILGHAKPSTTLNVYGHMMPNQEREAAEKTCRMYG